MTHAELVERAAKWVRRHDRNLYVPNCSLVLAELVTAAGETPDVIGFGHGSSVLVECKTSRADFLRDKNKRFRIYPDQGMGQQRLYLADPGVVEPEDLPRHWGLLRPSARGCVMIVQPDRQEYNHQAEAMILLSLLRRHEITGKP